MGRYLKKGSDLVIQMHFHPTGKEEIDRNEVGIFFVNKPVADSLKESAKLVGSIWMANYEMDIPAGEKSYRRKNTYTLPKEVITIFHGPRDGRLKPDTVRTALIRDVIQPLKHKFPAEAGEKGFVDGRLHSFRHYFCSMRANSGVPEQVVMRWLGQRSSRIVHRYYHLHQEESKLQMMKVNPLGKSQPAIGPVADSTGITPTQETPTQQQNEATQKSSA